MLLAPPRVGLDGDRGQAEAEERHRELARGGRTVRSFETRFLHRDGHAIEVQVFDAPLIDAAGKHRGWMGSVIDITEQKRVARLARAQDETMARTGRLVTLGEMASTLAHELNQPLAAIASYAAGMQNLMERGNADPALMREANQKLARQAGRAGQIIRRIQDLVKKREPRFSETRLDEVIALLPGAERPTILPLAGDQQRVAMHMVSSETLFWETMEKLKALGASSILVLPIEKMME